MRRLWHKLFGHGAFTTGATTGLSGGTLHLTVTFCVCGGSHVERDDPEDMLGSFLEDFDALETPAQERRAWQDASLSGWARREQLERDTQNEMMKATLESLARWEKRTLNKEG